MLLVQFRAQGKEFPAFPAFVFLACSAREDAMNVAGTVSLALKVTFLLFVGILAVYLVYANKRAATREHFEELSIVETAFQAVLNRPPNRSERGFFASKIKDDKFGDAEIRAYLEQVQIDVQKAYKEQLGREPTEKDLADDIPAFTTYKYTYTDIEAYVRVRHASEVLPDATAQLSPLLSSRPPEEPSEPSKSDVVHSMFVGLLNRDPTNKELKQYTQQLEEGKITVPELATHLEEQRADKKDKTSHRELPKSSAKNTRDNHQTYVDIINVYQAVLQRNPSEKELQHFYEKIRSASMDLKRLRFTLEGSDEYRILTMNQTNEVHSGLARGMTERQMHYWIVTVFAGIYGRNPTEGEEAFLRYKMIAGNMDEYSLRKYVVRLKSLDSVNLAGATEGDETESGNTDDAESLQRALGTIRHPVNQLMDTVKSLAQPSSVPPPQQHRYNARSPACEFDKDELEHRLANTSPQDYSKYLQHRNVDLLAGAARQGRYASNLEDSLFLGDGQDMVLLPGQRWDIPQKRPPVCYSSCRVQPLVEQTALIGTLLADAKQTSVGSIMPRFEYRELLA